MMYDVDVRRITKLAGWCPGLQKVVKQKLRGVDADRVKDMVAVHNRRMEDTLDEDVRQGAFLPMFYKVIPLIHCQIQLCNIKCLVIMILQ